MTSGLVNVPQIVFIALLLASVVSLAVHIRAWFASQGGARIDLRMFATPIALCVGPVLLVLSIQARQPIALSNVSAAPSGVTPPWVFVVVPILAAIGAIGLGLFRVGASGVFARSGSVSGRAVWISLAIMAPAVAMLDSISLVDVFFLLLASAAAISIDRAHIDTFGRESNRRTRSERRESAISLIAVVIFSMSAATVVQSFPEEPGTITLAVVPLFIALVVCLLLPLVVAVASEDKVPVALIHLVGDVTLLLFLLGCVGLVGHEVWLEIASMVSQLRASFEVGLPPAFFQTRDLTISGFARLAPVLFMVIPMAVIAVVAVSGSSSAAGRRDSPPVWIRMLGIALVVLSLVVLSWYISPMVGI